MQQLQQLLQPGEEEAIWNPQKLEFRTIVGALNGASPRDSLTPSLGSRANITIHNLQLSSGRRYVANLPSCIVLSYALLGTRLASYSPGLSCGMLPHVDYK